MTVLGTPGLIAAGFLNGVLGTISVAYQNVVVNIPQVVIERFLANSFLLHYGFDLTPNALGLVFSVGVVSSWPCGALVGCLITPPLAETFGRRDALMLFGPLCNLAGFSCIFLSQPTLAFELLIVGRVLCGMGFAIYLVAYGLYFMEVAPDKLRGLYGAFRSIVHSSTCLVAELLGLPFLLGTDDGWPYLLCIGAVPAVVVLFSTPIFPESPKHAYIHENDAVAAERSLRYFQGDDVDVNAAFEEFEHEKHLVKTSDGRPATLAQIFTQRHLRIPFFISILAGIAQNTGGMDVVSNFSTDTFRKLGVSPLHAEYASVITFAPAILAAIFCTLMVERIGRRPLLLAGIGLGTVGCLLVFISEYLEIAGWYPGTYLSLAGMVFIILGCYGAVNAIPEFIFGEICPQATRSITGSVAMFINWASSLFYMATYLPLHSALGPWVQFYLIVPNTLILAYLWVFMPETKDRPVDEIVKGFMVAQPDADIQIPMIRAADSTSLYGSV